MKRFLTLFLSLILSLSFFTFVGCKPDNNNNDNGDNTPPVTPPTPTTPTYDYCDNIWEYYLSDDNTYLSVKYIGGDVDELTVPTSYNDIPVKSLKTGAFSNVQIGLLTILDNIKYAQFGIFNSCRINRVIIDLPDDYDFSHFAMRDCLMGSSVYINYLEFTDDVKNVDTSIYLKKPGVDHTSAEFPVKYFILPKNLQTISIESLGYWRSSILYKGTLEDFENIEITNENFYGGTLSPLYMVLYTYSEVEPALNDDGTAYDGKYWRYVNNEPVIWEYTPSQQN